MRLLSCITFVLFSLHSSAQTLGGSSVFNFLKLSNTPQLTGLGGINISNQTDDIGMAWHEPSLLRPSHHSQINLVFNSYFAGIKNYNLMTGYHYDKWKTTFGFGVNFINYGTITQTDPSGNIFGELKPSDYVVQLSASRAYESNWYYGASLKFIHSNYGLYRSSGIAMDIGVTYYDTLRLIQASFAAKNMGAQIKAYDNTEPDDLPFDLQLGISKKLLKAPLQFSITAHHLHQFDIRYDDTSFNEVPGDAEKSYTLDKIFRHFIFATQLTIEKRIELTLGYNYLRRKELNIGNAGNGLNGFSLSIGILVKKIQIRYGSAWFQNSRAYHQFGLNLRFDDYFQPGK